MRLGLGVAILGVWVGLLAVGEGQSCTTQSAMKPAVREALAGAALKLTEAVQAGDQAAVKEMTIAEYQKDFAGVADVVTSTAPRLKNGKLTVEQVYVLDDTGARGTADAQFFCTLNQSMAEADFSIPQLPVGRYGFAMVKAQNEAPWRLSLLLREDGEKWLLAGVYPKELTAGGHDGLWYWLDARAEKAKKQPWDAWLEYQEAQALLQPVPFVSSTHLEKLGAELAEAVPPELKGVGASAPLVVKGADGTEYRFTAVGVDDSLGKEKVDVEAHLAVEQLGDAMVARKRNVDAMAALVAAHPELRAAFHGVWIFADASGQAPYGTEESMAEIH